MCPDGCESLSLSLSLSLCVHVRVYQSAWAAERAQGVSEDAGSHQGFPFPFFLFVYRWLKLSKPPHSCSVVFGARALSLALSLSLSLLSLSRSLFSLSLALALSTPLPLLSLSVLSPLPHAHTIHAQVSRAGVLTKKAEELSALLHLLDDAISPEQVCSLCWCLCALVSVCVCARTYICMYI